MEDSLGRRLFLCSCSVRTLRLALGWQSYMQMHSLSCTFVWQSKIKLLSFVYSTHASPIDEEWLCHVQSRLSNMMSHGMDEHFTERGMVLISVSSPIQVDFLSVPPSKPTQSLLAISETWFVHDFFFSCAISITVLKSQSKYVASSV